MQHGAHDPSAAQHGQERAEVERRAQEGRARPHVVEGLAVEGREREEQRCRRCRDARVARLLLDGAPGPEVVRTMTKTIHAAIRWSTMFSTW